MFNRPKLLLLVTFAILLTSVAAVAQDTAEPVTLSLSVWGGDTRFAMYNELLDRYEELHPNVTIEREMAGWGPYWERLATQTAGGNPPDIIHMHHAFVNEYAGRGALLDLTPLIEAGTIDLSDFPEGIIQSGAVGDEVYMISLGNSASGTHYNTRIFDEAGFEYPPYEWTWNDFSELAKAMASELPEGVYAAYDSGGWDATLELYMTQQGYPLFTEDGQLGFPKEALVEYWSLWKDLHDAGAVPPVELTVERGQDGVENNMLVTGNVAMMMLSGNQHRLYQQNTEDVLGLTTLPRPNDADKSPGDVVTGAYISIGANSPNAEEAANFISWFVTDPDVARVFNGEHGPPGSVAMQEVIADQQSEADHRLVEMMNYIAPTAQSPGYRPANAGEVLSTFTRIYQELAFGQQPSVEAAVDAFFDEADFILN